MKYLITLLSIFFISATTSGALACHNEVSSDEDMVNKSKNVYVGYVTGIQALEFEEEMKKSNSGDALIPILLNDRLRIIVTETVKGKKKEFIEIDTGCNGAKGELREKVKVYFYKDGGSFILQL